MRWFALVLFAMPALAGCLGSEAPLFEESKESVSFDPRLVGTWQAYLEAKPEETRTLTVTAGEAKDYIITQEGQANRVEAHIVGVMGYKFVATRELPPLTDDTQADSETTPDPYYYYVLLKEIVYDDATGAFTLTLGTAANPQFVDSFVRRHPEFEIEPQRIEPEGNKVGKLILQGETKGLRDAFAALGDTVDGFGAEHKLHLVPEKAPDAAQ